MADNVVSWNLEKRFKIHLQLHNYLMWNTLSYWFEHKSLSLSEGFTLFQHAVPWDEARKNNLQFSLRCWIWPYGAFLILHFSVEFISFHPQWNHSPCILLQLGQFWFLLIYSAPWSINRAETAVESVWDMVVLGTFKLEALHSLWNRKLRKIARQHNKMKYTIFAWKLLELVNHKMLEDGFWYHIIFLSSHVFAVWLIIC